MTIDKRGLIPARHLAAVTGLAILAGCTSAKVTPRNPAAAYADLPQSALNSPRLSSPSHTRINSDAPAARKLGIASLEEQLRDSPADDDLRLAVCEWHLRRARALERNSPELALGHYLAAAEHSFPVAAGQETADSDGVVKAIYNHAVGRVAVILHGSDPDWRTPRSVARGSREYAVQLDTESPNTIDPDFFDELLAADSVRVRGMEERFDEDGIGAAMIGYRSGGRQSSEPTLNVPQAGIGMPLNATVTFHQEGVVRLALHDLMLSSEAQLAGHPIRLAGDFSAPIARFMQESPTTSGVRGFFNPESAVEEPGIYRLEPFRRDKIPLIFVHGLLSHPSTWLEAYNTLLSDPAIRENYQFWFTLYTTGEPIAHNAARFRSWLQELYEHHDPNGTNPNMHNMVLVGHSMGGLLTSFQIREGGDRVWDQLFTDAIDDVDLEESVRTRLRELIYFKPDRRITRAVFVATPHRGSPKARRPIGRLGASLVRLPAEIVSLEILKTRSEVVAAFTDIGASLLGDPQSSVEALQDDNEGLRILSELPISESVTYHSIIGDRGKGDGEDGSDGVVPYLSSHLDGAASEKIVPSGHGAQRHPEGIAEIRRILLLHLRESGRL